MKTYDPKYYVVTFKGHQIQGPADGTFIKVSRMTDTVSSEAGAYGDVVRTRSHDRRGEVTITLLASSPSNDALSAFAAAGELGLEPDADVGPFMLKDINGTTVCLASEAWVRKPADVEGAKEHTPREWVLECAKLEMLVGGAL